jgi:hypothetical protein
MVQTRFVGTERLDVAIGVVIEASEVFKDEVAESKG